MQLPTYRASLKVLSGVRDKEVPSSHHCIVGEDISKPMSPSKGSVYLENDDLVMK